MPTWSQLRLTTPLENADVCAQLLLDAGCEGVQIDDAQVVFDESEDATIAPKSEAIVTGYVQSEDAAHAAGERVFEALQRGQIEASLGCEPVPEEDWANTWKQNFPPLHIGPFLIAPPWAEVDGSDALILRLDPGLAFGTGQHPTTRMCLELLAEWFDQNHQSAPKVLDVGCGSGILSIAAAKLGARVVGSDPDAFCADATRDNALLNDVEVQIVQESGASWTHETFDLVLANLMSDLLLKLAPDLFQSTRPGGTLIVSGISSPRADEVETALQKAGFQTQIARQQDGDHRGDFIERWAAFQMQKEK